MRVINGRATIVAEAAETDPVLRAFLKEQFTAVLERDYLDEALKDYIELGRSTAR